MPVVAIHELLEDWIQLVRFVPLQCDPLVKVLDILVYFVCFREHGVDPVVA